MEKLFPRLHPQSFKKGSLPPRLHKGLSTRSGIVLEELFPSSPPERQRSPLAIWAPIGAPTKKGDCIGGALSQALPPEIQKGFLATWAPKGAPNKKGALFPSSPPEPQRSTLATWAPKGLPRRRGNVLEEFFPRPHPTELQKDPLAM